MLFLLARMAYPCAGLIHGGTAHVESNTQHVIMSINEGNTSSEYRIEYEGDSNDFGWIIPIYGAMVSIEETDGEVFDRYEAITAPAIIKNTASQSSACASAEKGGFESDSLNLDFIQGYTGTFEYVVVPASDIESFTTWGDVNGWNTTSVASILPQYNAQSEISLVLLRIRQELYAGEITLSPSIRLEFEGNEMRYPALLGSISPEEELHTVIYIRGEGNATVSGWGQEEVGDLAGSLDDNGNEIFAQRLRDISQAGASFGTVFAGDIDGVWVTRLDSLVHPEQNTQEPIFQNGDQNESISTAVELSENSSAWIFGLGLLLGILGIKKRR